MSGPRPPIMHHRRKFHQKIVKSDVTYDMIKDKKYDTNYEQLRDHTDWPVQKSDQNPCHERSQPINRESRSKPIKNGVATADLLCWALQI